MFFTGSSRLPRGWRRSASPERGRAYADRYHVDFALVPVASERAHDLLRRSSSFRELRAGERYVLFERIR